MTETPPVAKSPAGASAPFHVYDDSDLSDRLSIRDSQLSLSLSLSNSSIHVADISGWLRKRGNRYKSWKRRFFTIVDNLISYYTDETQTKKKGEIFLDDIDSCELLPMPENTEGFILRTSDRDWYFIAEETDTKFMWIDHLAAMGVKGDPLTPMQRKERELELKDRLLREKEQQIHMMEKALEQSQKEKTDWREAYENLREEVNGASVDEELLDLYGINLNDGLSLKKGASFEDTSEMENDLLEQIKQMRNSIQLEKKTSKKLLKDLGAEVSFDSEPDLPDEQSAFFKQRSLHVFKQTKG